MEQDYIRRATEQDLPELADIEREADKRFPEGRLPEPHTTHPMEQMIESSAEGLLFVAEHNEKIVGFCVAMPRGNSLHIHQLSVLPSHGRRGIGRRLLAHIFARGRERGATHVTLNTFSDVPWNGPYYHSIGFRELPPEEQTEALKASHRAAAAEGMTHRISMIYQLTSQD